MHIRSYAILLLLMTFSMTARAQGGLSFGIRGGASLATLTGDTEGIDLERRIGLVGGAFLTFGITPELAIQPEVLYAMKGARYSADFVGEEVDATFKLDYVEVPVLLRYNVQTGSSLMPYVIVGPAVAFSIKSELEVETMGETETDDLEDEVEGLDFGVAFGGGLAFTDMLSVDVRYTLGIRNAVADPQEDEELQNGALSITLGLSLPN